MEAGGGCRSEPVLLPTGLDSCCRVYIYSHCTHLYHREGTTLFHYFTMFNYSSYYFLLSYCISIILALLTSIILALYVCMYCLAVHTYIYIIYISFLIVLLFFVRHYVFLAAHPRVRSRLLNAVVLLVARSNVRMTNLLQAAHLLLHSVWRGGAGRRRIGDGVGGQTPSHRSSHR